MNTAKELKKEIRKLRKLKNQMQPGSKERLGLGKKIKELQAQNEKAQAQNAGKAEIIAEILGQDKLMAQLDIDLNKHTVEDLQKYLNKLKKNGGRYGKH